MYRKFAFSLGLAVTALSFASIAHAQTPYCREYTRRVTIGGVSRDAYGTACQQPDGSWQIMNQAGGGAPPPTAVVDPAYAPVAPPPVGSDVTYIIHDDVPLYIDPGYIHYGPWRGGDYGYGYGFHGGYGRGYAPYYYGHGGYGGGYGHHHFNE